MPYAPDHKLKTRARIVESARVLFNRRGFEQVTIDDIMGNAGLTRGAFYHHFASKDELYAEAVSSFASCSPFSRYKAQHPGSEPARLAHKLVDLYLSDEVLSNSDIQCPLYALPSDVARAGLEPRTAYTLLIQRLASVFESSLTSAGLDEADAKQRALAAVSLCVGGMLLARTTHDEGLRRSVRAAARAQAQALLEAGELRALG